MSPTTGDMGHPGTLANSSLLECSFETPLVAAFLEEVGRDGVFVE